MAQPPTRAFGPYRPTRLGGWEVIAKIAGGGMSAIYLGRRVEPLADVPNVVALKIVRHDVAMDELMLRMFLEEGRLIARLIHPNIVRTLEVGGDAEQDFIAMELMLGKTFAGIHDTMAMRGVRINPDIAAWAAARIADALHYAHELSGEDGRPLGLVHRDVNPANVFATFQGDVKLFDFGLAKSTAGEKKGSNVVAGKLSYLSPEQIMQMPLDRRSDIFSLGTSLWELLTGRRLFRRDSDIETVRAVQLGPIPDVRTIAPDVPDELARIARTALERNREHRYPTAAHLARELDRYIATRTTTERVRGHLAKLVDTLFPGEQKRQQGWLKPAINPAASRAPSISIPPAPPSTRPSSASLGGRPSPPSRSFTPREVTAVMPNAPTGRRPTGEDATLVSPSPSWTPASREPLPVGPLTPRAGASPFPPPPRATAPSVPPAPQFRPAPAARPPSLPERPPVWSDPDLLTPGSRTDIKAMHFTRTDMQTMPDVLVEAARQAVEDPDPPPPAARSVPPAPRSAPPAPRSAPPVTEPNPAGAAPTPASSNPGLKPPRPGISLSNLLTKRAPIPLPSRLKTDPKKASGAQPPARVTEPPPSDTKVDMPGPRPPPRKR